MFKGLILAWAWYGPLVLLANRSQFLVPLFISALTFMASFTIVGPIIILALWDEQRRWCCLLLAAWIAGLGFFAEALVFAQSISQQSS